MEPPTPTNTATNTNTNTNIRATKAAAVDPRSSTASASASVQKQSKPLACTACRARKLGCNRVHPCYNCLRSGAECVFPARRRIQRPRKTKNTELLQRLSRLESIVGKVGIDSLDAVVDQDDAAAAGVAGVAGVAGEGGAAAGGGSEGAVRERARGQEQQQQQPPPHILSVSSPPGKTSGSSSSTSSAAKPRLQSFLEEFRDSHKRGAGSDDDGANNPNPQDRASTRYLSGQFWANLCGEVEGLRQVLEHSTDTEEEEEEPLNPSEGTTPESAVATATVAHVPTDLPISAGLLPGYGAGQAGGGRHLAPAQHPPADHVRYLTGVYFDNFDVIVKILHRPTMAATLHRFADALASASTTPLGYYHQDNNMPTPEQEALFFAIYYAAVTTLQPEACVAHLGGRERGELVQAFQAGLEHSLARADYLNSASLETLQALTIYVACLRCHSGSRASWALLSLPVRLAQALGLHREGRGWNSGSGSGSGRSKPLSPYETELRRRLWWQLIVLDIRGVEDRGTEPIIARGSYDTRLPLNLDDADFGPDTSAAEMRDAAEAREGRPTDMTFNLSTAQSSGIFLYLNYMAAKGRGAADAAADADTQPPSEEETVSHAQHLESQFVAGAADIDPARHVGAYIASFTVRLIILKLWLATQYPTHRRRERKRCPEMQQRLATTTAAASADAANAAGGVRSTSSSNNNHDISDNDDHHQQQHRITMTHTTITIHNRPKPPPPTPTPQTSTSTSTSTPTSTPTPTDPCPGPGPDPGTGTCPNKLSSGVSREATLRTAVSIMELSHWASSSGPFASRFGWWSATYVQWHPLAVALAELCAQTRGALVDRAWRVVDEVFPLWAERIADTKRGTLWRPIRKLHRKARAARRAALGVSGAPQQSGFAAGAGAGAGPAVAGETVYSGGGDGGGGGGGSIQARGPGQDYIFTNTNEDDDGAVPSVCDKTTMPHPMPESIAITTIPMIPGTMGANANTAPPPALPTTTATPWIGGGATTGAQQQQQQPQQPMAAAPDLSRFGTAPPTGWFGDSMAWPDVSFDLPMTGATEWETMDWSAWDEFINDTHAEGPWTSPSDGS